MKKGDRGFTLVEMIVAVGLFAVVMLVSVGALLALVTANRKAQALQSVMNNLNISLDGMVRSIRMGSHYRCSATIALDGSGALAPQDCSATDDNDSNHYSFAFVRYGGNPTNASDQWVYSYDPVTKRIYKSEDGGAHSYPITAAAVSIDGMKFYVSGTTPGDIVQPKVVIEVQGTAGALSNKTRTSFSIQATGVQRVLDL